MAALGLDSKLDCAPELPDVPWPSSAAHNIVRITVKQKLQLSKEHRRQESEERWQNDTYCIHDGRGLVNQSESFL
jgi:hypothetical protein